VHDPPHPAFGAHSDCFSRQRENELQASESANGSCFNNALQSTGVDLASRWPFSSWASSTLQQHLSWAMLLMRVNGLKSNAKGR
jgi:hypothetical protein